MVGNHEDLRALAEFYGAPSTIPVTKDTKDEARELTPGPGGLPGRGLVVLARYMQILSPALCRPTARQRHQHPPLLPAFLQGARPTPRRTSASKHGATAHYVTADLDEGPIIEQDVTAPGTRTPLATLQARPDVEEQRCWHRRCAGTSNTGCS